MKTRTKVLIGALVVIVVVVAGGLYLFFHNDAPAKSSVSAAAKGIATTTTGASSKSTSAASTGTGIAGTWSVEKSTKAFDFSTTDTGTFAGFRINENLAGIGSTTAVGRTRSISGTMTIVGDSVTAATFKVDLTTITTDRQQRNQRVQQALNTNQFPTGTFKLTQPIALPATASNGNEVDVNAVGDLTLAGVTKPVTMPIQAKLVSGQIALSGSVNLVFSDYGVQVPQSQIALSVDNHGILEIQLQLTKG